MMMHMKNSRVESTTIEDQIQYFFPIVRLIKKWMIIPAVYPAKKYRMM